ncbi:MAG: sulfotransferase [Caldilineaceae bacterium]
MADCQPNFLIIGAMRSGTTSLSHYLKSHPSIFLSAQKEIHYFDFNYDKGEGWYRQQFANASGYPAVGEATQTYMYDMEATVRMAKLLPYARLLVILRNPRERTYSHYWHSHMRGKEKLSLRDALNDELYGASRDTDKRIRYARSYLERSRYINQLLNVCQYYSKDALHVLLLDDLKAQPSETLRSVYRFLEIDDTVAVPQISKTINASVKFRSLKLRNMLKKLPRRSILRRVGERLNTSTFQYPPLDPDTRGWLCQYFAEDIDALEEWLGRDLRMWKAS